MNKSSRKFADEVANVLAYLTNEAANALDPVPGRVVHIAPGEAVAFDDCCEGQVWSRLVTMGAAQAARTGAQPGTSVCASPHFVATLELGIVRCAATLNNQGQAPSPDRITDDGEQGLDDMAALFEVLKCSDLVRSLGQWSPVGPQGGCFGGAWQFTVRLNNCFDCNES